MIYKMMAGIYAANCFIYYDNNTKDAVIFDPGGDSDEILRMLEDNNLNARAILLTHAHADHISGIPGILKLKKLPVYVHEEDAERMRDPKLNFSQSMAMGEVSVEPDFLFKDGDILEFGSLKIKVVHTPGHTDGSCCFEIADGLITGDTLFKASIGRTDLYGGSEERMKKSLKKFLTYPDNVVIYPGHGENSTIAFEKENNMFVR